MSAARSSSRWCGSGSPASAAPARPCSSPRSSPTCSTAAGCRSSAPRPRAASSPPTCSRSPTTPSRASPTRTTSAALTAPEPRWPESTRSISTLRLSLRVAPTGLIGGLTGPRVVHLDIVDYPGEWLLDLPLMNQTFEDWSTAAIATARTPARAAPAHDWLAELEARDPAAPLEEGTARSLAAGFTAYLAATRAAGLSSVAPGRFLMPGDLEGSPALTFSPLPKPARRPSNSLWRGFEQRFEAYKRVVVGPFFRNHFARLDRQVVLIDALGAIHDGPRAVEDLRAAMAEILACFRPGPRSWLAPILGRRIDRILFAATKADHLHHSQHAQARRHRRGAGQGRPRPRPVLRGRDPGAVDREPARHRRGDHRPRRPRGRRGARPARSTPAPRPRSFPATCRTTRRRSSPPRGRARPTGATPPTASPGSRRRGCGRAAGCRISASTAPPSS